jgi:hypothetical protein
VSTFQIQLSRQLALLYPLESFSSHPIHIS